MLFTIACWIFSPEKKKFTSQHKYFVLLDISLKHSHLVLASVLFSKFCCDVYAFQKRYIFCSSFHLFLESRTSSTHPQFATSYFLSSTCYRCKQRMTVFVLQTYSKILIKGILLKMLRNTRELDLKQAI